MSTASSDISGPAAVERGGGGSGGAKHRFPKDRGRAGSCSELLGTARNRWNCSKPLEQHASG
eukprot:9681052-Alexandrium_andersonii.AAC.1